MNRAFIENSNSILRRILNKEENTDILKNFIESVLRIKIKEILIRPYLGKKVNYLPTQEKYGIVNVRVIQEDNDELNVGIQIVDGLYIQEKVITYGASIHVNQLEYEEHSNIVKTATINIIDFEYFSSVAYHKIIKFFERDDEKIKVKDATEFHILELPKFKSKVIETKEEEWLAYLRGNDMELIKKIKENNQAIRKLDELLLNYWKEEEI